MSRATRTSESILEQEAVDAPSATPSDWDPRAAEVLADQTRAYDRMRGRCPVAHSDYLHWSLFKHVDVLRVLQDHETFSSAVSSHVALPNGLDPPRHGVYRALIDRYFTSHVVNDFEPKCRLIAAHLLRALPCNGEIEFMSDVAREYALRVTAAFMGWPTRLHEPLRNWTQKNLIATLAGDRTTMAAVALEFDGYIRELIASRRRAGENAPEDVTTRLLRERVEGRALTDEEIVSIMRNWTVGELATIAASVGIIGHYLATHPELQCRLREGAMPITPAIDEMLRIDAPLITNRRIVTAPTELGGRKLDAGARITIMWPAANRDESVFGDPDHFDADSHAQKNLLYGAGIHTCPGAGLARLELSIFVEELFRATSAITASEHSKPLRASYPAGGFATLPLRLHKN